MRFQITILTIMFLVPSCLLGQIEHSSFVWRADSSNSASTTRLPGSNQQTTRLESPTEYYSRQRPAMPIVSQSLKTNAVQAQTPRISSNAKLRIPMAILPAESPVASGRLFAQQQQTQDAKPLVDVQPSLSDRVQQEPEFKSILPSQEASDTKPTNPAPIPAANRYDFTKPIAPPTAEQEMVPSIIIRESSLEPPLQVETPPSQEPDYCNQNCRKDRCNLGCERKLFGRSPRGLELGGWLNVGYPQP